MTSICIYILLGAASFAASADANVEFVAVPIEGEPVTGRLASLTQGWRIVLQHSDRIAIAGADLIALRRADSDRTARTGPYVLLANGDRVRAVSQFSTADALRINSELLGSLDVPLERIQAIILGTLPDESARERLESSLTGGERKQDSVVLANGDEAMGTFVGMDDNAIRLEKAGDTVSITRSGVRAIAFSSDLISFPRTNDFYAVMVLRDGTELSVTGLEMAGGKLKGRASFGADFVVPVEQVQALEFRNGRVKYLSDMEPVEYRHTPYLELSYGYRRDRSVAGGPISLRGQMFRKGLGMHSLSELTYELDQSYRRFEAIVGIDDETAGRGSVNFRVLFDGREAWQSGLVTGQSAPKRVQLDVVDVNRLTLIVEFGAMGDVRDHADWASAHLVE
jgi:hypothetical protein